MAVSGSASGKFVLRVGPELHLRLSREAKAFGLSLNAYCVNKLQGATVSDRYAEAGLGRDFLDSLIQGLPRPPLAIVLFGSFARGDQGGCSDIDLLVVLESDVLPNRALYRELEKRVELSGRGHPVNPALVSLPHDARAAGSLWLEVALDGVVLWERGSRVSGFLREVRRQMAAGEVRRALAYGQPYWIRERGAE
jgi:predicted nucleotidyltransferase